MFQLCTASEFSAEKKILLQYVATKQLFNKKKYYHFLQLKEKGEKTTAMINYIINSRKNHFLKEGENGCVIKGLSSIEKAKTPLEIPRPSYFLKNKLFCVLSFICFKGILSLFTTF